MKTASKPRPTRYMCPHCGDIFARLRDGLIPIHDFPRPGAGACPGSQQTPRNPYSDRRPLWKNGGVA
jgi:hypothetical protein